MDPISINKKLILRLKRVSLKELIYLFNQLISIFKVILLKNLKSKELLYYTKIASYNILKIPEFQLNINTKIIKKILNGYVFDLNSNFNKLNKKFYELKSLFFLKIMIKNPIKDIRQLWEPSRLQHLTILLIYILKDSDNLENKEIKLFCKNELLKWIYNNPFLYGPNYISAMECGLRIPVFYYSLKILDNLEDLEIERILETIYLHAWYIFKRLSLYSSLGNHTVAECVGLIFAGAIFRNDQYAKKWFKKGICVLKKELSHQILDDGGPGEQSFQYLRFILDLYWLAISFLEKNDLYDCGDFKAKLIKAEEFLGDFGDHTDYLPSIGDSDNGFAIGAFLKPEKRTFSVKRRNIKVFKNSGYTRINTVDKVQIIFDHGSLGLSPMYNHGHSDALSITLCKDGKMILVDPGTYRYNGDYAWRRYFKGTRAHNTVTVDELDQAVQETGFIWGHPFNVKLLRLYDVKKQFLISAIHDGYSRLKMPVWHQRDILFFRDTCFLIKDSFKGKGSHKFEINFHIHPDASIEKYDDWWLINNKERKIFLRLLKGDDLKTIKGQTNPIHGWFSPCYGRKTETNVLTCKKYGFPDEIGFTTAICTQFPIDLNILKEKLRYFDK